jgi:hypothetical protein
MQKNKYPFMLVTVKVYDVSREVDNPNKGVFLMGIGGQSTAYDDEGNEIGRLFHCVGGTEVTPLDEEGHHTHNMTLFDDDFYIAVDDALENGIWQWQPEAEEEE